MYDYERAKVDVDEAVLKSSIEVYGGFWGEFFLNVANEDKERKLQVVPNYAKKFYTNIANEHYGGNISSQHYKENFLEIQKEVVVCLDQLELIRCG